MEEHALITNHLATALSALLRWGLLFPNSENYRSVISKVHNEICEKLVNENKKKF